MAKKRMVKARYRRVREAPKQPTARVELITRSSRTDDVGGLPVVVERTAPLLVDSLSLPSVGFGRAQISKDEAATLAAPMELDELAILPGGEVYPPQVFLRRKLNATFGPGGWGLRPCANPQMQGRTIVQPWLLMVRDQPVSVAYGEADYQEENKRTTWATALESCKSNALMRCCKDLGIAGECWDRRFQHQFRDQHCVLVKVKAYNRRSQQHELDEWWRRRDDPPFPEEQRGGSTTIEHTIDVTPSRPVGARGSGDAVISDGQLRRAMAIANHANVEPAAIHTYLAKHFAYTHDPKKGRCTMKNLKRQDYETVVNAIEKGEL